VVTPSSKEAAAVESQIKRIARPMYSNPPLHGAAIVTHILKDFRLKAQWFKVRQRLKLVLPAGCGVQVSQGVVG
jgi:aspartate/tyrosine/aromatic aminotransferase